MFQVLQKRLFDVTVLRTLLLIHTWRLLAKMTCGFALCQYCPIILKHVPPETTVPTTYNTHTFESEVVDKPLYSQHQIFKIETILGEKD